MIKLQDPDSAIDDDRVIRITPWKVALAGWLIGLAGGATVTWGYPVQYAVMVTLMFGAAVATVLLVVGWVWRGTES